MNYKKQTAESFITSVDVGGHHSPSESIMEPVRKEHDKIREVVASFSNKIEVLVDKQRTEYMHAYENHMQDVQKELHSLREKVAEIANDETKADTTAKLKEDQIRFKNEALKLEADSDDIRRRMLELVKATYALEKSRDWLLQKLRDSKKLNLKLQKEKEWLVDTFDGNSLGQPSLSNASSYTLEMKAAGKAKLAPITTFKVDRSSNLAISHNVASLKSIRNQIQSASRRPIVNNTLELQQEAEEQAALSQLIATRARRQELLDFVSVCANSLHKGPWSRVTKRPLHTLVEACSEQLIADKHFRHTPELLQLACELATYPETYGVIKHLINEGIDGKYPDVSSSSNDATNLSMLNSTLRDMAAANGLLSVVSSSEQSTAAVEERMAVLDADIQQYFNEESETKRLRSLGFFHKDGFLTFS